MFPFILPGEVNVLTQGNGKTSCGLSKPPGGLAAAKTQPGSSNTGVSSKHCQDFVWVDTRAIYI